MMVRVQGDVGGATSRIRGALASMPGIKPPYVRDMESVRGDATQLPRILGIALSVLSGIALLLTAIGLYGGVATWAATRRKEIGIRLALGASAAHVYSILLSGAGRLLAAGAIAGSLAAVAVVRLQQSRFGSTLVLDAGPAMSAILIFAVVMGVAAWLPARRSTKLPPAEVLRSS